MNPSQSICRHISASVNGICWTEFVSVGLDNVTRENLDLPGGFERRSSTRLTDLDSLIVDFDVDIIVDSKYFYCDLPETYTGTLYNREWEAVTLLIA